MTLSHLFAITKNGLRKAHAVLQCLSPTALQALNFSLLNLTDRFIILHTTTTIMTTIPFNCFLDVINALFLVTYTVDDGGGGGL